VQQQDYYSKNLHRASTIIRKCRLQSEIILMPDIGHMTRFSKREKKVCPMQWSGYTMTKANAADMLASVGYASGTYQGFPLGVFKSTSSRSSCLLCNDRTALNALHSPQHVARLQNQASHFIPFRQFSLTSRKASCTISFYETVFYCSSKKCDAFAGALVIYMPCTQKTEVYPTSLYLTPKKEKSIRPLHYSRISDQWVGPNGNETREPI
jgi:hypothetical protein